MRLTNQCFTTSTKTISFTGTTPSANGAGTFTLIYYNGDLDGTGSNLENIDITGETGSSLGNSLPTGQCSIARDSVSISIPMATINAWAATGGAIDFTLTATSAVNLTLCGASLCVDAYLTYPVSTVPNDAGASAVTPSIICPGSDSVRVVINNYGTNQIDSVMVNWSKNGTIQTPIHLRTLLDTAGGTGSTSSIVNLGIHTFSAGITDTFTVWTTLPNGVIDTTTNNDTVSAYIKPSLSGIYTIGGTSPDYATFNAAISDLYSIGVCGPITFNVRSGTYTEQLDLNPINGVSSINTITFKADPSNTSPAIITHAAVGSADNYVVQFSNSQHIIFDSLTINATGTTYAYAINFISANYVTIKNCNINASLTSTSSSSIPVRNASGIGVDNCTIENNIVNNGYYSIYWYGGGTTSKEVGNVIRGNRLRNYNLYGLMFTYQAGGVVENNDIEQSTSATSTSYGLYIYYDDSVKVRANKVVLHGSGTNYGMYMYQANGTPSNKSEVTNNMISTSPSSTGTTYGVLLGYSNHVNFYHNSVNCLGGSSTAGRAAYMYGTSAYSNNDVRNNIFSNSGPGVAFYTTTASLSGTPAYFSNLDYNIYNTSGVNLINYSGTYYSLSAWQSAVGLDSNSLFGSPGFISGTDLHLQGAIAYDNGDTTLGVTVDIDGDVRPLSPSTGWDIGADEYILPSCPSPYSMKLDSTATNMVVLSWTNGPFDSIWQVQYGAPGFVLGSGTIVSSSSNPMQINGLTHSTCYEVWLRSICTVGDTSIWTGPFNFCTKCAAVTDYCTSFETDQYQETPFCWKTYINTTSTGYIYTYNGIANTGSNSVRFYASADASATMMLIAPEVSNLSAGTHRANFWARGDSTIIVGTMSDPANPGTFTPWDTISPSLMNTSAYSNFKVDFSAYSGTDTYVAFLWDPASTYDYLYLDDYCWETIPSCEKAPSVQILNAGIDSTSLNVGWNIDTTQVSYIVAYGPTGYDPITNPAGGDTTTTTFNFKTITGLQSLTEYCVWVKAICSNGDTSFWDGPHCGSTGCPSAAGLPYFEDFNSYTTSYPAGLPLCWQEAKGVLGGGSAGLPISYVSSFWTPDGFGNVGTTGSAKMNIYSTNRFEWLVSPSINLGTDPNQTFIIEFDIAMTDYANTSTGVVGYDDTLAFVVSYDDGLTWSQSNIIESWDTSNVPSNTGDHFYHILRNKTGKVKFGFYATTTVSNEDNDWFIDNFSIKDTVFVGIDEIMLEDQFKIYPNPNRGVFNIQNYGTTKNTSLKLVDVQGRLVYDNIQKFSNNETFEINVENLNSGIYILLIQSEGKLEQHRVVIQ